MEVIYRIPVKEYILQFPAGMRDPGESDLVKTAIREMLEETGYVATEPKSEKVAKLGTVL